MNISKIIEEFKKLVQLAFSKKYDSYQPELAKIVGSYKVPFCSAVNAIFDQFLDGLQKIYSGKVATETMPQSYKVTVTNDAYGKKVTVRREDFERAQEVENLDLPKRHIEGLAVLAKDHPVETALTMIENGASNTYGTCFDGKNLFATDHFYGSATNQSNLLTGNGATMTYVLADLKKAIDALHGFVHPQGNRKHKFNKNVKPLVICPSQMRSIFLDIQKSDFIGSSSNPLKGAFELADESFADANDYYVVDTENDGNPLNSAIINPVELAPELTNNIGQESAVMDGQYKWQVLYRAGFAYGAWWKIVKVANS